MKARNVKVFKVQAQNWTCKAFKALVLSCDFKTKFEKKLLLTASSKAFTFLKAWTEDF